MEPADDNTTTEADTGGTQGGFGTGLRALIAERGSGEGAPPVPPPVAPPPRAVVPVPSGDAAPLHEELRASMAREQDLRTALAEQVDAYERKLAHERDSARHAVDLTERSEKLEAIESQLQQRERRVANERKTIDEGRKRLAVAEQRANEARAAAEAQARQAAELQQRLEERERGMARREADAEQRVGGVGKREERLARSEREVERREQEMRTREGQRAAALNEGGQRGQGRGGGVHQHEQNPHAPGAPR